MHLKSVTLLPDKFPDTELYPFNLTTFHRTRTISLSPVTFFVGENGTGKSTLLEALSKKCNIHIWRNEDGARVKKSPFEDYLHRFIEVEWIDGPVPGSFFSGEMFRDFTMFLDQWAIRDPGMLNYFGGESLMIQSHGQSLMAYFRNRYRIKGLYLLDEPETALSPKSQLALLHTIRSMSESGQAQFVIASHSPILTACPGAAIHSFDRAPVTRISYEDTDNFRIYKDFMNDRHRYLSDNRS